MTFKLIKASLVIAGVSLVAAACTQQQQTSNGMPHPYTEVWSGYSTATPATRAMQDDDFENPGMPYYDAAAEIYSTPQGTANKSCEDCHGAVDDAKGGPMGIPMKGVGAKYPIYDAETHKPMNVELRINRCRERKQGAKPFKYESDEMLGMTGLVVMQSRGMPRFSTADQRGDALYPAFLQGKAFYYQRRGQLDLSCKHCHEDNAKILVRAELLSQGQSNGFPTYRLKWQKPGSLHRRFRGCNKNIRAEPYGYGSEEYLNLETYLAWRGNGLPIEGPSVRK